MKYNYNPSLYLQRDLLDDELGSSTAATAATDTGAADTAGIVASGSGLIGGLIDSFTANTRANDARDFSQQQALQQRGWAIDDRNFALSDAPSMAMAGFKKAGLNPNLIYSQATNSPTVRSTPEAQYTPAPATLGKAIGNAIPDYQNAKIKQVQTDNASLVGQNILSQTLNNHAELVKRNMENNVLSTEPGAYATDGSLDDTLKDVREKKYVGFNNQMDTILHTAENKRLSNVMLGKQITSQDMSNALQAATQESNITIGLQKGIQSLIQTSSDQTTRDNLRIIQHGLIQDNELKQAEIALRSGNIDGRSPVVQTLLRSLLDAALIFAK